MSENTQDGAQSNPQTSVPLSSIDTLDGSAFSASNQTAVCNSSETSESASTPGSSDRISTNASPTFISSTSETNSETNSPSLDNATASRDTSVLNTSASSSQTSSKGKGRKPGNPGNFLGEHLMFLQTKVPDYLQLNKGEKARWFQEFKAQWFVKYPWHTGQEPLEEELQAAIEADGNGETVDDLRKRRQKEIEKLGVSVGHVYLSRSFLGLQLRFLL